MNARSALAAAAVVLLGPILTVVVLQLPLVNQLRYADAWFYSAYAWVPEHHMSVYPWNYFAVRFPAILSIGVFERVLGTEAGYVALRYLLAAAAGAAIFVGARRFTSTPVAVAATLLLYLNPFFSRMLLWDYSAFMAVAAGTVGIGLWFWTEERHPAWTAVPAAALVVMFFSYPLFGMVLLPLFVVEAVDAVRGGRPAILGFLARVAIGFGVALVVLLIGWLAYLSIRASIEPGDMVEPIVDFLGENEANATPYQADPAVWLWHEPRIWGPVLVVMALLTAFGRRLLGRGPAARVAQVCILLIGLLWLYRFTVPSSVIETWWAYSATVVVLAPAVAALLHQVLGRGASASRWVVLAVAGPLLVALVARNWSGSARLYADLSESPFWLMGLVVTGALGTLLLALRRPRIRLSGVALVLTVVAALSYAPSIFDVRGGTGIFAIDADTEWRAYPAAEEFLEITRRYDRGSERVMLWYRETPGVNNLAWAALPQYGNTLHVVGVDAPMDRVTPLGRARMLDPATGSVMVMSSREDELRSAQRALASAGFEGRRVERGRLGETGLGYVVVRLVGKPAA